MTVKVEKVSSAKAHTRYRLANGTQVPGTTTVLGVLNKPALVRWANQLGLQGIDSTKYVDALATIGTCAHLMIQSHLNGEQPDLSAFSPEEIDRAENSFLKFLEWEKQHHLEVIFTEHPLVSERYRYGGTVDCYCTLDGAPTLLDFKTSKAIYVEHIHQLGAYQQLLRENGYPVKQARILQIGRTEDEGFTERTETAASLRPHWQLFKACLEVYRLKKVVGG